MTPGNASAKLSWAAPSDDGGSPITNFLVERSLTGTTGWTTVVNTGSPVLNATVTGLANGTRYYFRVRAVNAAGTSQPSAAVNTVPRTVPSAVRSLTLSAVGSGQLRLSWLPPSSNGGAPITDYAIQRSLNGTTGWVTINDGVRTTTTHTVTGLANGTRYYLRVFARNAAGLGPSSTVVNAIPRRIPTAVRSLTAVPTNLSGQIRLTWLPPASNGGLAITDYLIQHSPNGRTGWVTINDGVRTTTTHTFTGLANGTRYYFRVFARNAAGLSPASAVVNAIPRTKPTAVSSLRAAPTNLSGQIRLTWVAPTSNGGAAITDYAIQRSPNGRTGWVTINDGVRSTTTHTITGLANGTRYYFRVFAHNAAGFSPASAVVNAVPRTVPGAVIGLRALATAEGDLLDWDPPASNGGSPITAYVVQAYNFAHERWDILGSVTQTVVFVELPGIACNLFRVGARNAAGIGPFSAVWSCFEG